MTLKSSRCGLFFNFRRTLAAIVFAISTEVFGARKRPLVLATGGNAARFERDNLFAELVPDLILLGLHAYAYA